MISLFGRRFYSPQEVADVMGVTQLCVYNWINSGKILARKAANGRWLIDEREVRRMVFGNDEGGQE